MATTSRYTLLGTGANFMDFYIPYGAISLNGQEIIFKGNSGVDQVYVGSSSGLIFDFTQAGLGVDKIYLSGSWADYSRTWSGSTVTLTRTNGGSEVVKVISGDSLVFADGTVSVLDALNYTKGTVLTAPVPANETSATFPMTVAGPLSNTVRAVVLDATGETIALSRPGVAMIVKGGSGVDVVYVTPGGNVDGTQLGLGQDKLYLNGNWADYTGSFAGSAVTLTRTVGADTETVKFLGGSALAFDSVVFADGVASSYDILRIVNGTVTTPLTLNTAEVTPQAQPARTIADLVAEFISTGVQPVAVSIADTAVNLVGGGVASSYIAPGVAVAVTDTITIAELALIDAANGWGSLSYSFLADIQSNLSTSTYIKSGVNVAVTDAATISQLSALDTANGTASVTATSIVDTAANLAPGGVVSSFITSGVAVSVTNPISLTDLAAIDTANGAGALTYVGVSGTLNQLSASMASGGYLDPNNPAAVGVAVVVSNTAAMADLQGFLVNTGVVPVATSIADTAQNLSDFSQYITSGVNVTVTDAITVAGLNVIDTANGGGALSYSLADIQANLSASAYVVSGVNVTVTDDATIAQLNAFNAANGAASVTATSITDTAANLASGGVASSFVTSGVAVNVTNAIPLTDLAAIDLANGTGALAYVGVSGTLSQLNANGYVVGGVVVTVTDAASLADLTAIQTLTGVQPVATSIVDSSANLISGGVASPYVTNGVGVTVTGATLIDDLAAIDTANGTASVTANTITDVAAKLVSGGVVSSYINTGVAVNVTDTISIIDLAAINTANGIGALTYAGITGTLSEVTPYVANGVAVTVTDAVTIQNLVDIQAISNIKPVAVSVADTAASLLNDGLGGATNYVTNGVAVTVTDTVSVADLVTIDTTNGGAGVTVTSLTDTAAALSGARTTYIVGGVALTVTDAITISDLTLLDNANNGTTGVTLTSIADTAANLVSGGVASVYIAAGVPVAVTDSISLANLSVVDTANGAAAVTYAGIANTSGTAGSSDILQFSSALNAIDFTTLNLNGQPLLQGFEMFDLATDVGANAVTLTAASMFLQASNLTNASTGAEQVLTVNGGANDTVTLLAGGFAAQGAANGFNADGTAGTGYDKYVATYVDATSHALEVLVQTGVVVL